MKLGIDNKRAKTKSARMGSNPAPSKTRRASAGIEPTTPSNQLRCQAPGLPEGRIILLDHEAVNFPRFFIFGIYTIIYGQLKHAFHTYDTFHYMIIAMHSY